MNYKNIYEQIINKRKGQRPDGYVEVHHIIPRSLGGSNNKENLVALTAREHFICHLLLTKIYTSKYERPKIVRAFLMMLVSSKGQQRYFSSRSYESLRKEFCDSQSEAQQGSKNSQHGTRWIYNESERKCNKIKNVDLTPDGWKDGRIINWESYFKREDPSKRSEKLDRVKFDHEEHAKQILIKNKNEAEFYFSMFLSGIYKSIRDFAKQKYPKSHVYLTKLWKKYIPQYSLLVKHGKRFNSPVL